MHDLTLPRLRSQALRRAVCLAVLFAVLLLQVHVALAGCLASAVEPVAVHSMDMTAGCDEGDTSAMRACLQQCEQASETPASFTAHDTSDLHVPMLCHSRPPELALLAQGHSVVGQAADPLRAKGPPVYLRLLRLLI